jgi:hypothetical protein
MLQILYLLLEGVTVIVPALLAVAFICVNYKNSNVKGYILIFFIIITINNYLLITIFPTCILSDLILNHDYINLIINLKYNLKSYCEGISIYFYNSNWSTSLLLSVVPISKVTNLNISTNSIKNQNINYSSINPWFITGFTDGEGSFYFSIVKTKHTKIGWSITIGFNLVAKNNPANLSMLKLIQQFFGVGKIVYAENNNIIRLIINGLPNCIIIRDHFLKFPLLTYKLVHFKLWCAVIDILIAKEHLVLPGLLKIIALKAHSPLGLSRMLLSAFKNYTTINCPEYNPILANMNIHWIAGFMNADGSFGLNIQKPKTCRFRILITQHSKSLIVMLAIKEFFGVGTVANAAKELVTYKIFNLQGVNTFINKFNEAQLLGAKALDYQDFCKGINIINNKEHINNKGFNKFNYLANNMNSKRNKFE